MGRGTREPDHQPARVYRYRLRSILRRQGADYLVLTLIVGLIGGLAMGSVVIGRRTQSAFSAFLRQDHASTLTMSTYGITSDSVANGYSPGVEAAIRRLPQVQEVEAWAGSFAVPIQPNGVPNVEVNNEINVAASVDGLYFDEDRATVIRGRMANPDAPDEFVTSALGAQVLGVKLGETVPFGYFDIDQLDSPEFGTTAVQPVKRYQLRLVGIVEFNDQVVEDDTDRYPTNVVLTPAFTRQLPDLDNGTWYGIRLRPGVKDLGAVEQKLVSLLPTGSSANFNLVSTVESKVETSLRPESIALAVFGLIAILAAIAIGLPVIARIVVNGEEDRKALRAMGAAPATIAADSYAGILASLVAGCLIAAAVAVLLSSLGPLGPVRRVFHPDTFSFDWTVIGPGIVLLLGVLGSASVLLARRRARSPGPLDRSAWRAGARVADLAVACGAPPAVSVGIRFALERGNGRTAVPARAVLAGAVVAVALVVTTLTFGSGLRTLVSRPSLYGWNWSYALTSENDVPPQALAALAKDPEVEGWSGYTEVNVTIDGQIVPVLGDDDGSAVNPPLLSGHQLDGRGQVVLGQSTLATLGKRVGDTVEVGYGSPNTAPLYLAPQPMRIVGAVTLPAIAGSNTFSLHTSMGVGGVFDFDSLPASFIRHTRNPDPTQDGPPLVFIRYRPGVSTKEAEADLDRIIGIAAAEFARDPDTAGDEVTYVPIQRPAAIVNYQSTGDTPLVLAAGLAFGTIVALALSLVASVRRRRRDLAVLKTLGFVRHQVLLAVVVQGMVTAVIADAIGIPVGIAAGRQLWIAFARSIDAVPAPTVPWSIVVVGLVTVALASAIAVFPGRLAARTPAAAVLRTE